MNAPRGDTDTREREQPIDARWKWKHLYHKSQAEARRGEVITALCGVQKKRGRGAMPVRQLRSVHCPLCVAVWQASAR